MSQRFQLIGPEELAEPVPPMEWLIRGLWPAGSYGPWGGAKKTLKTYSACIAALAVASGMPAFGNPDWRVPEARPVVYYGGEGSRAMHARRLQRIAGEVYGVPLEDLPFHLVTDIGPLDGKAFRSALRRNAEEVSAGLVVLDSLYNYHPADIEVGNLYERGRLLGGLSALTNDLGVALWVVDHFNKTGSGIDLDRLAQAGMAQWADSWVLMEHSTNPDVPQGRFSLSMGVGSRQWGGTEHTLHLDIGAFDAESGAYATPIKVEVADGLSRRSSSSGVDRAAIDLALLAVVKDNPESLTKQQVVAEAREACGAGDKRIREAFADLAEQRLLVSVKRSVTERSRQVTRDVWTLGNGRVKRTRSTE